MCGGRWDSKADLDRDQHLARKAIDKQSKRESSSFSSFVKVFLLEAVNPVYRRRRLAKVLQRARFHKQNAAHWGDVANRLDRKVVYGMPQGAYDKHVARQTNAENMHFDSLRRFKKAYWLGKGRKEHPGGFVSYRVTPANPLRLGRDEKLAKHSRTAKDLKDLRQRDKEWKQDRLKRFGYL